MAAWLQRAYLTGVDRVAPQFVQGTNAGDRHVEFDGNAGKRIRAQRFIDLGVGRECDLLLLWAWWDLGIRRGNSSRQGGMGAGLGRTRDIGRAHGTRALHGLIRDYRWAGIRTLLGVDPDRGLVMFAVGGICTVPFDVSKHFLDSILGVPGGAPQDLGPPC